MLVQLVDHYIVLSNQSSGMVSIKEYFIAFNIVPSNWGLFQVSKMVYSDFDNVASFFSNLMFRSPKHVMNNGPIGPAMNLNPKLNKRPHSKISEQTERNLILNAEYSKKTMNH